MFYAGGTLVKIIPISQKIVFFTVFQYLEDLVITKSMPHEKYGFTKFFFKIESNFRVQFTIISNLKKNRYGLPIVKLSYTPNDIWCSQL